MKTRPCWKIALVVLAIGVVLYCLPAILPGENDVITRGEYPAYDSDEFPIMEEADDVDEAFTSSDILTITTYIGFMEAHLITFPDGSTMSIDCGYEYGDVDTITTISHFDRDHCGDRIAGYYNRTNVIPGQVIYDKDGVTVTVVAANGAVIGEPPATCTGGENHCSMALLVRYGGFDYLTAGDLDTPVERPLGAALKERGIHIDVHKVSHHGSKTSSDINFLLDISPEYAVIAGGGSEPHIETMASLVFAGVRTIYYAHGYPIYPGYPICVTTNGTVTTTTDGYTYSISGGSCGDGPIDADRTPTPTATPTETPTWDTSVPTYTPTATPTLRPEGPWPMFGYDAARTGQSIYVVGPKTGRFVWSYETNGYVESSPVVGFDGRVYVGSYDDNLYAITSEGTLIWSYLTGYDVISSAAINSDGTVHVGSYDDNFYALTSSGLLLWSHRTGGFIRSSAVIDAAEKIYVGSDDNVIYTFSSDGRLKWSYETAGNASSSPAVGNGGNVYTGSEDNVLYALRSEGSFIWSYLTWDGVASSPAIKPDGSICVGAKNGFLYAFNSTGSILWRYLTAKYYDVDSSPVIDRSGDIYVGSNYGYFYGLTTSGEFRWSYWIDTVFSSAAIGSEGHIYIGAYFYRIYAFTSTGCLTWSYRTGHLVKSSPAIGSEGYACMGSRDRRLYAFKDPPTPTPTITPTPTVTQTPTITPTPTLTPRPIAENVLSSAELKAGDRFEVRFVLHESIEHPFTAFAVIILPGGKMINALTLDTPVRPVAENISRLQAPFSCLLLSTTVPKGAPKGVYEVVTAFFYAGKPIRSRSDAFLEASASFTIAD